MFVTAPSRKNVPLFAAALFVASLFGFSGSALAQSSVTTYSDNFQSYGKDKSVPGWVVNTVAKLKPTGSGRYKTRIDPTQGSKGTNIVYGTQGSSVADDGGQGDDVHAPTVASSNSLTPVTNDDGSGDDDDDEHEHNGRNGSFSTYTTKNFTATGILEFRGRFIRTKSEARIGLTVFSSYPDADRYYIVGLTKQGANNNGQQEGNHNGQYPKDSKLTMQVSGYGAGAFTGTIDSKFVPDANKWYGFLIQVEDKNGKTTVRAKFWLDTNTQPTNWMIDASDASANRLKSGRIGMWAADKGEAYIDDVDIKSAVDHTPPTVKFLESTQPLGDNAKFNRVPAPEIVVTDDMSTVTYTAKLDGAAYTSKTPVNAQGNHTLTVHAVDAVGNATDATVHFFVDTIPPAVTVVSPKDGSMTANDVTVLLQVVDASLPYTVAAKLDNATYDVTKPITTEGKHTLAMTVTDGVGLATVVPPITFTIDKSNPTYVLKEGANAFPSSGFVFDRDVTASVDATDLTPVTVKLTLDGAAYVEKAVIAAEGDHTIAGTVADAVGHIVTIPPRTFTIDKSAPVVTITESGAPVQTYYDRAVTPVIKVTDYSNYTVTATLDGQPFTFGGTLSAEKKYTLAGSVKDSANHTTSFGPIVFYVDLTAPQVSLTSSNNPFPASGFVFDADVAADVTISDLTPTKTVVTLDGQSVTLPLAITTEKTHKLTAVVTDSVNRSTTATVDFVIDKTPPSVDVEESGSSLQEGRFFSRKVTPVVVVTDSTATTVKATLDGQPFTSGSDVTAEGPHTIAGTVTDAAKHTAPIGPVSFTIDTIKPTGVFKENGSAFPAGQSLNRDVKANVEVTDASPVTVTVLLDGQAYHENDPITTEQSHTLSATLLDKAGNQGVVAAVTFRIDRTPPTVKLLAGASDFPADYAFNKDIVADVRVDDASPTTTVGNLDGTQITFPHTITTEGPHTITATATDAAGLSATTAPPIHFILDKTPPSVVVLENGVEAVPNKVFGVDVTVTFTIDQGASQRTAYATLDGAPYTAGKLITAEGVHTIAGEVKSASGLSTPIKASVFTIDKTKPVVKLLNRDQAFPPSGYYFNSDVVPVVECTDNLTHCTAKLVLDGAEVGNNTPITAEGAHTLQVSGKDEAGNETILDPVTFTIDKTPPAVTITSHTDAQIVTEPQAVIAGGTDDAVTVTVNGVAAGIDFPNKTYKTPSALPLLEGENIIAVIGIDRAGNPGTKSLRLILDTRNPSLTVKSPAGGACITDADLVVSGSVTDPNIQDVSVTVGANTVPNALDSTKQGFSAKFTAIAEGPQTIVVIATDVKGHRTQATLSLFVDRGAPAIDVLESGQPFTAKQINHPVALTLRARDLDPNVQLSAMLDTTRPYASGTIVGGEGAHRIDVVASDCAGHQATLAVEFTIDTTAPVISAVLPANGATIAAAPASITGTVSGDAVRVELEGKNISATPVAGGDFTLAGAAFAEGANAFTIRATDAAGNFSRLPYSFTVKSKAPGVEIFETGVPLVDGKVFARPVSPVVHSDDTDATVTALLNGATYDGQPVSGDGHYTIEGRATDKLNHTGSLTRSFTIDMTPPAVHIASPIAGDVTTPRIDVSGSAGDAVSVTVNGIQAQLANGNFSATGIPLDIGENTIIAAAADSVGNIGRDRIIINLLGAGPGIIVTEPADASLTNRPRIDVAGRVLSRTSDDLVKIGSAQAPVDAVGDFRFNGYQLAEGDNVISVSATGQNLQTATAQIHVTADFTPPALTVLAGDKTLTDNAQFPDAITLTLHATDNRGTVTTTLSLDGAVKTVPVTVSSRGGHVVTATARDAAGNETRADRTFFIGNTTAGATGCHIDSTDPADGSVISASTVKVAGRAPGASTVTVAGTSANVADSTFAASIDLPAEGANAIVVQCADAGGITASRTITLIRATGNPSITITSPAEGFVTTDRKITVSGTVSADVDTADVNGLPATVSGGTFTVANVPLTNGLNTLVAHGRKKGGRVGAHSVRVQSIQTSPDISISSPLSDYQTGDTKVTVSGTWSNLDPATIALSGNAGLAPHVDVVKISDTSGSFTIAGVGLAAGDQTLTVTGRNVASAVATSSVKVTVAANQPSITITSPADNAYLPGDQPIAVTGTFGGASAPRIDINGSAATVATTSYSGSTPFSTAGDVTPVVARLTDANGNGGYASIRVNRLTAPFAVKEAFPAPNAQEVDPGVVILLSFNAPLDMITIPGAITLKASDGTSVTGRVLVDDMVLAFAPTALLQSGMTYTIAVSTSLKNAAGMTLAQAFSSSFTTASSAPSTPPSIDPITSVDCTKPLTITGSAPPFVRLRMDAATLTLTGNADATGKFSFTYPFNGQSGYQVARVRIVGADGSFSPAAEVSFRFDCALPQVVGASYDRTGNLLTISFSKPVDPATLVVSGSGTIVLASTDGSTTSGSFTVSGSNVVVTPATSLRAVTFTLTVTDSVKDTNGNKLAGAYSQTFSVSGDEQPPAPGDGSGFISGEVYDATTGRPLIGADVTVIVPATAFAKTPTPSSTASGRYTIVDSGASKSSSSKPRIATSALQVAVNSATESRGRYTIPLPEGAHTIQAAATGYTTAWRQIVVPAGAGVVPIDIRLTKRGDVKTSDGVSAISLSHGTETVITRPVAVTIPAGVVLKDSQAALTAVGAQSLAGLLPLGWSPLASAEVAVLDASGVVQPHAALGANAQLTFTLPSSQVSAANQVLSLVQYDDDRDEWRVLAAVMIAGANDKWSAPIATSGAYAVVYADKAPLAIPPAAAGGATLQPAASTCATNGGRCELVKKSFDAEPKTILPNGRTVATLQIISGASTKFPSGTAVQAYVNEELHLPGGTTLVDPPFATDILLYRNLSGDTGFGQFHLAPSAQATKVVLSDGVDHIQILQYPGRLDRGTLIGAEGGRVPGDDNVAVEIPSSATTVELHASVSSLSSSELSSYGTIAGFRVVGGFALTMSRAQTPPPQDLNGDGIPDPVQPVILSRAARATVAVDTTKLPSASSLVIVAEVVNHPQWGRIVRLADPMSAIDTPQAGVTAIRYTTRAIDPSQLPVDGVVREGRYLILAAEAPIAYATGAVRVGAGGLYLADARLTSYSLPTNSLLGVADATRNTGVFAVPVAATPAAGFALQPKHAATGDGAAINSTSAPAPDTVVKLGDVILTPQSPTLVSTSPANGASLDVANPLVITMTFSAAIDAATAKTSISVVNAVNNSALLGTVTVASNVVTFSPVGPLSAAAQYVVSIQTTLRGINGAPLARPASFAFSTNAIPTNQTIDPLKVHITIPENGVSRVYGDAGAIPGNAQGAPNHWRVVPIRQGTDFVTRYQADSAADGSFSLQIGNGVDASDRVTMDDVIDLRVINPAGNVAAVIRLTPFITPDGKGFIAPFGVTTTFRSVEGITVTVPAGAFDEPKLLTVALAANNNAFSEIPNVASELNLYRSIELKFDGVAKQRIDVSIPINGLATDRDYFLGWLGQSVWGPRMAVVDTLRIDGQSYTTSFPSDASVKKTIAAANSTKRVGTDAGLTDMQIKSCLVGVTRQGSYAMMDWTMPAVGGGLGWAVTWGIQAEVELMNDLFHSIYLPDFAFSSRNNCAAMPIAKGKPFTLTGVNPSTGMVEFKTSYDPIAITDPAVVTIPSPQPDKRGPYPVFGVPYRIETIDFTGEKYNGRGYDLELQVSPPQNKIQLKPVLAVTAEEKLAEKTKIQIYNVTKSRWSAPQTVGPNGQFPSATIEGDRGDQIVVYLSTNDIPADTRINLVFSEAIDLGTIPPGTPADQQKKLIDDHLHTALKFERVENNSPSNITNDATFSVDSQNRRLWVTMPAPLHRGATYRLTMLKDTFKDTAGNKIAQLQNATTSALIGDPAQDLVVEFTVRDNPKDVLTKFLLQATPGYTSAALRDLAQSGNLAFASALDAGLLVYDLSDPDSLQPNKTTGAQPDPYSLVPARWIDPSTGQLVPGANGFEQHWAVTTDQHNRVYGAGFNSTFAAVRVYKVEDFVKAHNDSDGKQCSGFLGGVPTSSNLMKSNCQFYGATIVGWRPGWAANMPLSTNLVMTDYPEAFPRKMQIATQDVVTKYKDLPTLDSPATVAADKVAVENKTELGVGGTITSTDKFRFDVRFKSPVVITSPMPPGTTDGYLVERITIVNDDLDLRWSTDKYLGEDGLIKGVVGRKGDRFRILRNAMTYDVISLVGYGIALYDMRAVESNDMGIRCGDSSFNSAHAAYCQNVVFGHPRLLEKIINTNGDGKCEGTPTPSYAPDAIQNIQFSAESLGYTPSYPDPTNPSAVLYDKMKLYGLDARKGVLDLNYALSTDGTQPVAKCTTRGPKGLVFRDPVSQAVMPRLEDIKGAVNGSPVGGPPRFNAQSLFHWEVTAAQNQKGLRGSKPNEAASRDYTLIAAGTYGLLIVEIGGTQPPNGPGYTNLENNNLVDVIWFASGCYALRVIPKTNLATVLDGKGHVLIVDLSNIDQRWVSPNPNPAQPASRIADGAWFPLTHNALIATPAMGDEIGIDDSRVIYKSPYVYTTGVIPPLVDPETGISFGGDSVARDMRTAALFDPPVQVMVDLGKGLEPVTGIVPLGVEPPPHNPNLPPTDPDYAFPKGSLAAFRVRVTLPGSIAQALSTDPAKQKLQFALEGERMQGALTEQTPVGVPAAHLRHADREGKEDKRKVDLVFTHEADLDPNAAAGEFDKDFRHQAGFNRLVSPWIIAIADPRASEHVVGDSAAKKALGCVSCDRPEKLHGLDEQKNVYELFTNGRTIAIRPESNTPNTPMSDAMKGVYKYLGENGRLELHVPTTMADTVRGTPITVAAQAPPVAGGALSETTYVHSGEVEINAVDMIVAGRAGNDIAVMRTHRSRTIGSTALGNGWEAPFLRRLRQLPNGSVEYRDGQGEVWTFAPDKTASTTTTPPPAAPGAAPSTLTGADTLDQQFGTKIRYVSPKGLYLKLARNESGWMLFDRQWRIARFDNFGRLTSVSDEFWKKPDPPGTTPPPPVGTPPTPPAGEVGNTTFYSYNGTGRLIQIVDSLGRKTDLSYWPDSTMPNDPAYDCTVLNASRTQPCKYAGLLSKIKDWRNRDVIFEYDKNGRLIGVQRPKVEGPPSFTGTSMGTDFKTDDTRPRVSYAYVSPTAPTANEPLQSQPYTDFMELSGNVSKVFDAAENAPPTPGTPPAPPRARVRFDYVQTPGDPNRDRVSFQYWPCGDYDGSTCAETTAKFEYPSTMSTKVTDMLGQERDYDITDLVAPIVAPATEPDPQKSRFKHISKETAKKVPTIDKSAPPLTPSEATTDTDLITSYTDFDEEGGVKVMTLPNGTRVETETLPAKNGAPGRIVDKITESRGTEKRVTKYTYDGTNPNAANTPTLIGRSSDGTTFVDRDAQSPSRERKTTQKRDKDPKVKTKTETTFDNYGRATKIERREDDATVGAGALVEQRSVTYKDSSSATDLEKGRADHVKSDSPTGGTNLDTELSYAAANTNGQIVTAHDLKRNVYKDGEYDSMGRLIHTRIYDGTGTLSETWTGYDASGRLIYSAHRQDPFVRVETFLSLDPLGRVVSTRTTNNKVNDNDEDLSTRKEYSVSGRTLTTFDPTISGTTSSPAKITIKVDTMGRAAEIVHEPVATPAPPSVKLTENATVAYDKSGLVAYTSDTQRNASYTVRDAFGRGQFKFGVDKLATKTSFDEWDQIVDEQILGTDGSIVAEAKEKYSAAGHLRSRTERVDPAGGSSVRYRLTIGVWEDGGTKTGLRAGETSDFSGDLTGAARATEQKNDGSGRLLEEVYGSATGPTGLIAPIRRRVIDPADYVGDTPTKTTDYASLRSDATVETQVVLDGLDRVRETTVGASGPSLTGYTTKTDYDEAGNVTKVSPPSGKGTVELKFDGRGLPHREIRNGDIVVNYYDERGTLRKYHDETLFDTTYNVDALGRVVEIRYPDVPQTTEEFRFEDKTGALRAHKDRKDVWLSYVYDEGGRVIEIHNGEDPTSGLSPVVTKFEYDSISKRLTRTANKDAAVEYSGYDALGRVGKTVTYRYSNETGLDSNPAFRKVLDVHSQLHTWSVFDSERATWRMPVTGPDASAANASPWLTLITENHDASTNLTEQLAGSATIVSATPAGVGELLGRKRTTGTTTINSVYSYADLPIPGAMPEARTGRLRKLETSVDPNVALAGSEVFHDASERIGISNDLAFVQRQSRWTYDYRGRIETSKLLIPQSTTSVATPITDKYNLATFRNERDVPGFLSPGDHTALNDVKFSLRVEPPKWTVSDTPAHEIASKTFYLDGTALSPVVPFAYDGGRRTSDGTWTSAFDQFERLTSIESADRRIEYTYDPRGRIIGRSAKQKSSGPPSPPWVPETRAYLLTDDGLPANTTWVWDPVVDRLIAIYEAGKSTIPPGSTSPPAADAGLLRQYIHGDRAYDDPVQVLIASADGASPVKYFPIVDEVATGSLQAVLDKDGNVVERVLYGDSYGDAPRYLQGPTVDSITYASSTGGSVDIRVHTSEKIKQMTVAGGSRLVALKGDGSVSATAATPATLDADQITLHWHLSSGEWSSLTAGAQSIEVAVTSTLRTYSWGDVPFAPVPELGRRLYGAKSASNTPVAVQSSITYLSTLSGSGSEEPLYEIRSPYLAGVDYSKTKLLTAFHSLPFNEPANGLIFARTRWYDPATGTFITPDPLGYRDASSLYAFAGGDPVNHRDPSGMGEEQSARAGEILARDPYIQCTVGNALGSLKGTAKTAWGFVAGAASLAWQGTVGVDDPSAANAALDDAQDFLFHPIKRWHKVSDEVVSKQASGDCFGAGETLQEKFVAPVTVTVVGGVEMVRGGLKTVPKVEETPPTLTPVPSEPAPPVPETAPKVPPAVRKVPGLTGLRFGRNDLVYGPSARGYLRALQQEAGGVLLDDLPKPPELSWEEFTVKTMNEAAETGRNIRFDLTHMEDLEGVLNNQGPWKNTVTAVELRYLKANWARFSKVAHFYVNGVEVKPPWVK